ncbi:MAG: glutamate--tRNA ligase [Candidatus Aenigmarchaeota archaeon]|nr:glutamate--tRNA ligase [Candidatus Aenigmarchaeota archaeon]
MADSLDYIIRKYCLINATEHEGTAQPKSVLGKILGDHPDLRSQVLMLRSQIDRIAEEINRMSPKQQRKELEKMGGYVPTHREERKGLPDLERKDKFVVRFAPNPDGALHMGNARPAVLCDEYAKKYNGKFILRFEDTDPKVKTPEKQFYKWAREDLKWLGIRIHQEIIQSKRLKIYYKYAEELIKKEAAYVCTCGEKWKSLRDKSQSCDCRRQDIKTTLKKWKRMVSHAYKQGQAVLRIKTDMDAKNPAVRDWPAFRIVDKPKHPLQKAKLWPLYNFASAIDDHLLSVTHIFRGQEHSTNEVKQRYLYQHMGWSYPAVITLGRFSMSDMVMSKSRIREGIAKKKFTNWDDPRLGTLRALKRRGFLPEAIRQIIIEIGPKPSDVTISFENLSAYNRKLIDKHAKRFFFIPNPKKIVVKGMKIKKAKIPMHPDANLGFRNFSLSDTFFIDAEDFEQYKGLEVRLKDLCNIKLSEHSEFTSVGNKAVPKIQWVPAKHTTVRVIKSDKIIKGYGELNIKLARVGDVVQFERFGFVKIEKITGPQAVVVFAHD